MKRRILAAALVAAMVLGLAASGAWALGGELGDVGAAHPNYEAIRALTETGVMSAYPDGTFRPEQAMTRAQFVVALLRAKQGGSTYPHDLVFYHDIPADYWAGWHINAFGHAYSGGSVSSGFVGIALEGAYFPPRFYPEGALTCGQAIDQVALTNYTPELAGRIGEGAGDRDAALTRGALARILYNVALIPDDHPKYNYRGWWLGGAFSSIDLGYEPSDKPVFIPGELDEHRPMEYRDSYVAYSAADRAFIMSAPTELNSEDAGLGEDIWLSTGSIAQFRDMAGHFAFAYAGEQSVYIRQGGRELKIEKIFPLFGSATQDEAGNFYIAWGRENATGDPNVESLFVSKYSYEGKLIASAGFKEAQALPFNAGNCDLAIGNGVLAVHFAFLRHDGHQESSTVAVNIDDMSRRDILGSGASHSFAQRVLWWDKYSCFAFADLGDASPRGFVLATGVPTPSYSGQIGIPGSTIVPFGFWLPPDKFADMLVVNDTNSQMGGIAFTSRGLALVGASAKSYSAAAYEENENLFIQIIDDGTPSLDEGPELFVTKGERSGTHQRRSTDEPSAVTDYGVQWLTDYGTENVYAPQVAATDDDRLVVLWQTVADSYYMILDCDGQVLKPATAMGGKRLVAGVGPVYADGAVYWLGTDWNSGGKARIHRLAIPLADGAGAASPAGALAAQPTASTVLVDGKDIAFDAYNIGGSNYFKLRDLAYVLSGTEKQFEVGWDGAANAIALTSGKRYTAVGGEMEGKGSGSRSAAATSTKIYLDGKEVTLTAYNIGGNNYFRLRDIGQAFGFGVDWDGAKNTIVIDTGKGYTPE
ncbi:MAG: S-layer homology domain-containing protein [Clostridiales Family XIII bacterium]|jgi:hypothetical protein|nr:S-layer homology domain-containing protein [Clostridiales Family XIII bacterium]